MTDASNRSSRTPNDEVLTVPFDDRPADSLSVVGGNRAVVSRPTASPVRWHFLLDTMWSSFRRGFKSSETSKTRGPAGG